MLCENPQHDKPPEAKYLVNVDEYAINICAECAAQVRKESPFVRVRPLYSIGRGT